VRQPSARRRGWGRAACCHEMVPAGAASRLFRRLEVAVVSAIGRARVTGRHPSNLDIPRSLEELAPESAHGDSRWEHALVVRMDWNLT
jgi:hypothetical protein